MALKIKNKKKVPSKELGGTNNTWTNKFNEMGTGVQSSINNTVSANNQPSPSMGGGQSGGAAFGMAFAQNLGSAMPGLVSAANNNNLTAGQKTGTITKGIGDAAASSIPGFGQFYGMTRGAAGLLQSTIPDETKYDRNTGQAVEVKKSQTTGQKAGAAINQVLIPDHEHASNSWALAADSKSTGDKLKYGFQGVGDLFGITKIGRMVEAAKGNDPDGRDLTNVKFNQEYQNNLNFSNYQNGGVAIRDIPNGAIQNYDNGGKLETFNLSAHSQMNPNFANTHLDGKPVQIEKNETILRKENGGDYVFSDNKKMKNPVTGNTFAKDSKLIENKTKKPFLDTIAEKTKEIELNSLMKLNDVERAKKEGNNFQFPNGGRNPYVNTEDYPELVDFSQRPQLEALSMDTMYPNQLTTNQGLLPLSGIQGNFNKVPQTTAGSNWTNQESNNRDNLTLGDKMQLAGILPGTLYNTVRAFQKPEQQKLYTDKSPITQQAIAKNLNPAYLAYNAGREGVNNATSSDAVRRASLAQMTSNLQKNVQDYSLNVDNQNKALRTQFEDRLANQNRFNIGQKVYTDDINARNREAQKAFGAKVTTQLGEGLSRAGYYMNQGKTNEIAYSALQNLANNYKIDADTLGEFLKGQGYKIKFKG